MSDISKDDFLACFGHEGGHRMLTHLRRKFGVDLPVFQRREDNTYCSDDALIRDGNREVVLYLVSETDFSYGGEKRP